MYEYCVVFINYTIYNSFLIGGTLCSPNAVLYSGPRYDFFIVLHYIVAPLCPQFSHSGLTKKIIVILYVVDPLCQNLHM